MNAEFWKKQQPPTHRDFEIYRYVKIEDHSTREAAEAWSLSQTRVVQVVHCVEGFLCQTAPLPKGTKKEDMFRHVWVAENVAAERLQRVTGAMMRLWQRSLGVRYLVPKGGTKSNSVDECRYALTIGKLSLMQAKLPASQLFGTMLEENVAEAKAVEADGAIRAEDALPTEQLLLEDETHVIDDSAEQVAVDTDLEPADEPAKEPANPPLVGCSEGAVNRTNSTSQQAAAVDASGCQAESYCEVDLRPYLIDSPDPNAFRTLFTDEEWAEHGDPVEIDRSPS